MSLVIASVAVPEQELQRVAAPMRMLHIDILFDQKI
jgi:hypothetical protein